MNLIPNDESLDDGGTVTARDSEWWESGLRDVFPEIWATDWPLPPDRLETTQGVWLLHAQVHSRRWVRSWRDTIGPLDPSDVPVESLVTIDFDAVHALATEFAGAGGHKTDSPLALHSPSEGEDVEASFPLWRGHLLVPFVRVPPDRVLGAPVLDEDGRRTRLIPTQDGRRLVRAALLGVAQRALGNEEPDDIVSAYLLTVPVIDFGEFVERLNEIEDPRVGEAVRHGKVLTDDPFLLRLIRLTAPEVTVLAVDPSVDGCRTYMSRTERSVTRSPGA